MADLLNLLLDYVVGMASDLLARLPEWIDPVTEPEELSRDPAHQKRFNELLERNPRFSDPVYRANVQKLIERHRQLEDARK